MAVTLSVLCKPLVTFSEMAASQPEAPLAQLLHPIDGQLTARFLGYWFYCYIFSLNDQAVCPRLDKKHKFAYSIYH